MILRFVLFAALASTSLGLGAPLASKGGAGIDPLGGGSYGHPSSTRGDTTDGGSCIDPNGS